MKKTVLAGFIILGLMLVLTMAGLVGLDTHYKGKINRISDKIADIISEKDANIGKVERDLDAQKIKEKMLDDIISEGKTENDKLKKKIKELLTVENKSELHITNYILKYYKKVPPVLAKEIAKVVLEKSAEYNVSFHVIVAVMEVESNFDPFSVSKLKKDPARGLMQVRYNVWKKTLGIKSAYDLHSVTGGIDAGTRVLRTYLDQTKNNLEKTLYKYVGKNKAYVRLVYAKMGKFTAFVSSN